MYSSLISTAELHADLGSVLPIDCRFDLAKPDAGRLAYEIDHIPGALYAHLNEDLSSPVTPWSGRHPLPHPAVVSAVFGRWGIGADTTVVVYDADTGMYASRLWWLLRWLGHSRVSVLDGGYKAWRTANLPVSSDTPKPKPAIFVAEPRDDLVVSTADVEILVTQSDWRVLDARAPERFRGEVEPIDPVAGHIPGARNHPFAWNMGGNGRLLPKQELAAKLSNSLGVAPNHAVMMCGSGVTACHNLLAMEVAGLTGAKLYGGSWSEWIRDSTRPVATGDS